jgi:hypothetical protein
MNFFTEIALILTVLSLGFCQPKIIINQEKEKKTEIYIDFNWHE